MVIARRQKISTTKTMSFNCGEFYVAVFIICDPILENHTSGHMQNLWEFSIENFSDFFKLFFFAYSDKATIKPSCCEISHP